MININYLLKYISTEDMKKILDNYDNYKIEWLHNNRVDEILGI